MSKKLKKQIKQLEERIAVLELSNPFPKNILPYMAFSDYKTIDPCDSCSNNPKNGGSGVCVCTLGNKTTY